MRIDVEESVQVAERLNRLGVSIALGEIGNGYASLSYLSILNPKIIKINRSALTSVSETLKNESLVETVVALGQQLHSTVVAERMETERQYEHLRHLGCDLGQGFLFSPAVPADEAANLVGRVMGN